MMPHARRILHVLNPLLIIAATCLLQGCFAVVAGGALVGADAAHDRRPVYAVARDRNIQLTAFDAINRHKELVRDDNSVKVVVYNQIMLLVGQVRSEELRRLAEKSVSDITDVTRLVNEIEVTDQPQGFWGRRNDNALTARVKTGLLDITSLPGFDPTRVNVTTSHHVVYLMGWVSHEEGDAVADVARDTRGVEKVVKLYEYTD
jgi:osmotically-inducible protein OsmY